MIEPGDANFLAAGLRAKRGTNLDCKLAAVIKGEAAHMQCDTEPTPTLKICMSDPMCFEPPTFGQSRHFYG